MAVVKVVINAEQGRRDWLAGALTERGLTPLPLPLMVVQPVDGNLRPPRPLQESDGLLVFSPRAAGLMARWLEDTGAQLPPQTPLFAMGRGTARALQRCPATAANPLLAPRDGAGSAALLAQAGGADPDGMDALLRLRRPLLVGGYRMRPLLRLHLAGRGAEVAEWRLYRRVPARLTAADLKRAQQSLRQASAVVATSTTVLRLLCARASAQNWPLDHLALLAASERIGRVGRALGFGQVRAASSPCALPQLAEHWARQQGVGA